VSNKVLAKQGSYNADVETLHNTISIYYNLVRKNSYKYNKSPLEILIESGEDINPEVLTLPALNLDKLF